MSVLNIIKYGENPILTQKTLPVVQPDRNLNKFVNNMIQTMYAVNGLGLAANQVGKKLKIFVIDITKEKNSPIIMYNPEIVKKKGKIIQEEGCLSLPGIVLKIKRAEYVKIKGLNKEGKKIEIETTGLLARAFQHEIDHLNGKTIVHRLPLLKRISFLRKLKSNK